MHRKGHHEKNGILNDLCVEYGDLKKIEEHWSRLVVLTGQFLFQTLRNRKLIKEKNDQFNWHSNKKGSCEEGAAIDF